MLGLDPASLISSIIVLLVAFPIHEFAHALAATWFGDDTPERNGRLTLNPLAHLDVMGSLLLVVAGFGWAKPVPVNPYTLQRRAPSALMWVSLAGPLSNLLLAILAAVPFKLGLVTPFYGKGPLNGMLPSLDQIFFAFVSLNLVLAVFNLIPLDPLDGAKILAYLLPPNMAQVYERIRPYAPVILLLLVLSGSFLGVNILWAVMGPIIRFFSGVLMG